MFWYYMEGEDVGQLTVSVQTPEVPRSLGGQNWTRTGDQGGHWRHARVTVDSREAPYQVGHSDFSTRRVTVLVIQSKLACLGLTKQKFS